MTRLDRLCIMVAILVPAMASDLPCAIEHEEALTDRAASLALEIESSIFSVCIDQEGQMPNDVGDNEGKSK